MDHGEAFSSLQSEGLSYATLRNWDFPEQGAQSELDRCVATLDNWLVGLTASDVSLMVALCPVSEATIDDSRSFQAQSIDPITGSGVVHAGVAAYRYRITVVDTQTKPMTKIAEHVAIDADMVAHWRGVPPERICDPSLHFARERRKLLLERNLAEPS